MSFSRYPEYKDSGVEWLGEVPGHWAVTPFKRLLEFQNGSDHKNVEVDHGYPVYGSGGVFAYASEYLHDGESVLLGRKGTIDRPLHVTGKFWTVDTMYWTRIRATASGRFCYYAATTVPFDYYSTNTALPSMTQSALGAHWVACPLKAEQTAIAAFLDRETGKIDALVAEQEKLIALLKEKRQAVISHAVTKGLNPDAPMKPSGIEWLGDVPAHWTVMPIRLAAKLESGHTPSRNHPEYWENCEVPWFTLADVWQIREQGVEYVYDTKEKVSELGLANSSARLLPKGTVILSRTASVGFSAVMGVDMATTQDFANWICGPTLLPDYLLFVFRSMSGEFRRLMMGSTHNTIYMPDIQAFRFVLPPVDEQQAVVLHVRAMARQFDDLINQAEEATTLLKERRSALISAAVTGQIDVRGLLSQTPVAAGVDPCAVIAE
ncbi:restriction endonuclease subunit S [Polycyclovorans algicola]|uniref:restriction endonuclease subunit S n=1 Tax=Polycyclovorans algicola TaxID=616992 RepID=UPI000AD69CA0|nr:restriction endonuclease subunit S [Polycyclovorans algicola]